MMENEDLALSNLKSNGAIIPTIPLPAIDWTELLAAESSLADAGEKIVGYAEQNNRRLASAEIEAVDLSLEYLKSIRKEKLARDARGDRGPRNSGGGGRLSEPTPLGGADASPSFARPRSARMLDVFGAVLSRANNNWKSLREFVRCVANNPTDTRLIRNSSGMNEGIGPEGGFLVPPQFATVIADTSLETEVVRPRADVFPATSNTVILAKYDTGGDHSTGDIAGLSLVWTQEEEALVPQKARITPQSITIPKCTLYIPLSNELLDDAVNIDRQLTELMSSALSFGLDREFLMGSGVGRPLGLLNSPSLITVAKDASQTTSTVIGANLLAMMGRLHPACEKNAIWLCSPSVRQQLYSTSQEQGVNMPGVNRTVTSIGTDLFIMGRPVVVTEKLLPLGTLGDVILVDLSQYRIVMRSDLRLEVSAHERFSTDQTSFRLKARISGMGKWETPITPRGGGPTLSWCVTLAARP